jgi:hypothetical protein
MPAIQAVLRGLVASAAKGNGPAQRIVVETIQAIEREFATPEHTGKDGAKIQPEISDRDRANALAVFIAKTKATAEQTGKGDAAIQHEHKNMTSAELARRFEEIIAGAVKKLATPKA